MFRYLACLSIFWTVALAGAEQPRQPDDVVHLDLSPAAVPAPSLKYRLLPDRADLVPGNAATLYYRAFALFFENPSLATDVRAEHWDRWLSVPLPELPRQQVRDKLASARHLLRELEVASHYRDCDWQLQGRSESIGLLLPDVQGMRRFGILLAVRVRLETAQGRYPQAVAALQTGYALARNLGRGPTFIHVLVGSAVANLMTDRLLEFVQQPGTPNLYWSLAVLPRPFIDPSEALVEEGRMLENSWPWLRQLEGTVFTQAQVQAAEQDIRRTLEEFALVPPNWKQVVAQASHWLAAYAEARQALMAQGFSPTQLEAMPVFQVVGLHAWRHYRRSWDELMKWAYVTDGWRQAGYKEAARDYRQALARLDRLFFRGLLNALAEGDSFLEKVFTSSARVDRRLTVLRCLEAIRLYARAHDGRLPPSLPDITDVPVPPDPVTGRPLAYQLTEGKARLSVPLGPGEGPVPRQVVYEVTMRR